MYYITAGYVIAFSLAVLAHNALWVYDYICERKERKKAASKALTQQRVHDEWTVYRNRRDLWWEVIYDRGGNT